MIASKTLATTRQAAEILGVHESSIKRWNTSDQLQAQQTQGGHRRFAIEEILSFAKRNKLDAPLLSFDSYAERVWIALEEVKKKSNYKRLINLVYEWILDDQSTHTSRLIIHLTQQSYPIDRIIDVLIAPVLHKLGEEYLKNNLTIGDEHRATHTMRDMLIFIKEYARNNGLFRVTRNSKVAIVGCGREEEHEIGAIMARLVLEYHGWRVIYLGLDVPTEEFAHQQIQYCADLVCISLMPPRGERDVQHILNLLDQMYTRKYPYRLAFGGGAVANLQGSKLRSQFIPDAQVFRTMETFSTWLQKI